MYVSSNLHSRSPAFDGVLCTLTYDQDLSATTAIFKEKLGNPTHRHVRISTLVTDLGSTAQTLVGEELSRKLIEDQLATINKKHLDNLKAAL